MGEIEERGCTLLCYYGVDEQNKPTAEEMWDWLQNESGLSQEYFDKILQMKFDAEIIRGLEITFDDTANCFIAIRQIENCSVFGKLGKCEMYVGCPKGKFQAIRLVPERAELLSKNDVIDALKNFGEIIQMWNTYWHDTSGVNIPTGVVEVRILTKNVIPSNLNVGGVETRVDILSYPINYDDELIQKLWDNCKSGEVDYSKKTFDMINREPGCKVICKFETRGTYFPKQNEVYEWLVRDSGLSEGYRNKIAAFKVISEMEYQILFDPSVNCLLAMKQMANPKVRNGDGVNTPIQIHCPKGRFVDVKLTPTTSLRILSQQNVEEVLKAYGIVTDYRVQVKANFNSNGFLVRSVELKLFRTKDLPWNLEINGIEAIVEVTECKPVTDEESLISAWSKMTLDN